MANKKYESVVLLAQPYLEKSYAELPENLREYIDAAFYPCPEYWDTYTRKKRERQIDEYDLQQNPGRQIEYNAGWWLWSMDANAWWLAESISPLHAAMLLSRFNPNTEKVEDAETNPSDEMGPDDFRRLKNIFDGASKDRPRTLEAWMEYAQQRGLKIHSWISEWEAWVREVDAKQVSAKNNAKPLLQQLHQEKEILRVIEELGYEAKALPKRIQGKKGVKAEVRGTLKFPNKVFPLACLVGSTPAPFRQI